VLGAYWLCVLLQAPTGYAKSCSALKSLRPPQQQQQQQQQLHSRAASDQDGGICDITGTPSSSPCSSSGTSRAEPDPLVDRPQGGAGPAPRIDLASSYRQKSRSPPSSPNYLPAGSPAYAAAAAGASPAARQAMHGWGRVVTTGGSAEEGEGEETRCRSYSRSPPPRLGSSTNLPALVPGVEQVSRVG
jgi:hypothetical protein